LDLVRSGSYWILPELLTILGFCLALVFLAYLLRQKRSPTSTIAWLLVVIFLPYIGVPLYLMLGGRKMSRMAGRKEKVYPAGVRPRNSPAERGTERLLSSHGVPPATSGNRAELIRTGVDGYRELMRLIDDARSTIHITTYILGRDQVGRDLIERLSQRAREGIVIRLLLDDVGSWLLGRSFVTPLVEAGAKVAYFMPMIHLPFRGRANLRNHRKIVVVDGRIAMVGGMNLAFPYLAPEPTAGLWRDLAVIVEGPAARDVEALFESDWNFTTGEDLADPVLAAAAATAPVTTAPPPIPNPAPFLPASDGGEVTQVVASGPDVDGDPFYESLLSLIFAAQQRIWIVTPYFVPDEMLARALNLAARRGVDVRLVMPSRSNHIAADLARESYLRELHHSGCRVLLYDAVMLHAKAILFDEELVVIGSANMDMRSLFLNYEVSLFFYSANIVEATSRWMATLMADCRRDLPVPSRPRELIEDIVRLLSPLL
jgi:cardiolipin synthase